MVNDKHNRRIFLKYATLIGGLGTSSVSLNLLLTACSSNVSTSGLSGSNATASTAKIVPDGLKNPVLLQWGADYVNGAPYIYQDPQNPSSLIGFEVEIVRAIANLMGILQMQIEVSYPDLNQALVADQFDMILNSWEKTPDREKTQLFSDPYYRYGQQIIVRKDDTRFDNQAPTDINILEGLTVGTCSNCKAERILQGNSRITIKTYIENIVLSDLIQKKVDAFFLDSPLAVYYVLGSGPGAIPIPELRLLGNPIYADNYYAAFSKNNPRTSRLLPKINQALTILKKDGTLKKIYKKWQLWNDLQTQIGII